MIETKLSDKLNAVVPGKLLPAESGVMVWFHDPEPGTPIEALMFPAYWAHVAKQLRPGHRIEALSQDGEWWANLIVRAVGRAEAQVQVLQHEVLGDKEMLASEPDPEFEVKWRGPARKFGVVRKSDGQLVKEDLPTKDDAIRWVSQTLRNRAA